MDKLQAVETFTSLLKKLIRSVYKNNFRYQNNTCEYKPFEFSFFKNMSLRLLTMSSDIY